MERFRFSCACPLSLTANFTVRLASERFAQTEYLVALSTTIGWGLLGSHPKVGVSWAAMEGSCLRGAIRWEALYQYQEPVNKKPPVCKVQGHRTEPSVQVQPSHCGRR